MLCLKLGKFPAHAFNDIGLRTEILNDLPLTETVAKLEIRPIAADFFSNKSLAGERYPVGVTEILRSKNRVC